MEDLERIPTPRESLAKEQAVFLNIDSEETLKESLADRLAECGSPVKTEAIKEALVVTQYDEEQEPVSSHDYFADLWDLLSHVREKIQECNPGEEINAQEYIVMLGLHTQALEQWKETAAADFARAEKDDVSDLDASAIADYYIKRLQNLTTLLYRITDEPELPLGK